MPQHLPPTEPAPAALQSARYTYDGDGAMVRGEVNGVVTFYAGRHYHQEVDGSETTVRKYYALGSMTIAMRSVEGAQDTLKWVLGDHLGSTSVTANEDGSWNSELRYTAFGEVRASQGLTPTEYRFTNQLEQIEIGLYYYGARWYDPYLNHFVQADSIVPAPGNPMAWDRYAYVLNSPVRYTDPSGHRFCEGAYNPDPLPKSSYTKQYYQEQLKSQFDWYVDDDFSYRQMKYLNEKAWEWRLDYSNVTSGHGEEWMKKNLGRINFEIDTIEQNFMSRQNNNVPTSFVFGKTVYFADNFMEGKYPDVHVFHEITHVWDNSSVNALAKGLGRQATFFGGGIADRLIEFVGGTPSGIRFENGNFSVPKGYELSNDELHYYGNNSYADYFAQINALRMVGDQDLPRDVVLWIEAVIKLTQ